ncbi:MAG: ABC transporter permease [Acidobacteriota bacterium]
MLSFIARRLIGMLVVLFCTASLLFALMKMAPGDPARLIAGQTADPNILAKVRAEWHLDDPIPKQYVWWMGQLVRLELPDSYVQNRPVSHVLANKVVATCALAFCSIILAFLLGTAAGIIGAYFQGTWLDTAVLTTSLIWISTPVFWLGLMFILLFASRLRWLPASGYGMGETYLPGLGPEFFQPLPEPAHLVLPAVSLALLSTGYFARMMRSSLLEVVRQDFIRTATAKGLSPKRVILKHALRNALIPVVTIVGINFAGLLGGAVATEYVFAWPGMGKELLNAINLRDYPVMMGGVLSIATVFVCVNLLVDISYAWIDPRIRHE